MINCCNKDAGRGPQKRLAGNMMSSLALQELQFKAFTHIQNMAQLPTENTLQTQAKKSDIKLHQQLLITSP